MKDVIAVNAIPERPWPTMNSRPYTVDYQCGSSDITQSNEAKVMVMP